MDSEDEDHDLPDGEKKCDCCGHPFDEFPGTEDSEVVEVEVRAYRRRIRRKRYKKTCRCAGRPGIVTAPGPAKLIPKGAYGVSFWVLVLLNKFLFQQPTYRLLRDFELTQGLRVSQGTVTGGMECLAPNFEPLYEAIRARCVSEDRWHADETRWLVFEDVVGKTGYRWWLWVFRSESTVSFVLDPSRSSRVAQDFFGKEARGILNVDRYIVYKLLAKESDDRILLAFCWAHVRRDFLSVAKDWPTEESWAFEWIDSIRELYGLNKQRLLAAPESDVYESAQEALCEALDGMEAKRDLQLAEPNLHPARRKTLESLKNHWSGLTVFRDHPEVPMDNNQAERDLRNPVVGRKGYFGSGAIWAGKLAVWLFSIFQTLLVWDINPRLWMTFYLEACAQNGGNAPADVARFLPWNLPEEQLCKLRTPDTRKNDTS
ncbi:MAG: IS66 family transposase [Phycisphaerae bacterium]